MITIRLKIIITTSLLLCAMLSSVAHAAGPTRLKDLSAIPPKHFDLQAHRGGRGEQTEESLAGFIKSVKLGVTTLELDINLTKDLVPLVWHDSSLTADKCRDTQPATVNDPQFPYVGHYIHDLTYRQISTVVCDRKIPGFPQQVAIKGNKIATLDQLFEATQPLSRTIRFNIESKIEPRHAERFATPNQFVSVIVSSVQRHHEIPYSEFQSFDWRTLPLFHRLAPSAPLVALWDTETWHPGTPWTGGISYESVQGDPYLAAQRIGAVIASPQFADDKDTRGEAPAVHYIVTRESVAHAHQLGLKVVPWTPAGSADLNAMIDDGADGFITDFPTKAKHLLDRRGISYSRD